MKKPMPKNRLAKLIARRLKNGTLVKTATGRCDTPGAKSVERMSDKQDFGLSPFYLGLRSQRSLHSMTQRFHRAGWTGPLGMNWLKNVR